MREKAVQYKENLCFKCLCECENIHTYELGERGYGSIYDGMSSKIQLCDKCNNEKLNNMVNELPAEGVYWEEYKLEKELDKFVDSFPIQGQELFHNQCVEGWTVDKIDSQEWIDIELGVAEDEIYKKNNMYSPSEIKAYQERFPKCNQVQYVEYKDGSSHTKCDHGAFGDSEGNADRYNFCDECLDCAYYEEIEKNDDIINYEVWLRANDIEQYARALKEMAKAGDKKEGLLSVINEMETVLSSLKEIAMDGE